ncbi:DNA translocase FtsK [Tengunoibacter tsumagoiensis]|uniref:FtsK domain-containing protein n=1 Tax=Tengunoibacter tsumagoiensis TaxID=2014871 RepID=A0A401ZU52_9CHLR|nr:DNA translocase FtsK [Tengunoibacter tsumagoiensis]GCE10401.1 hypothetical protein KTT_02600 [Tengunoibacter tsumagoiensis]
MAGSGQKKVVKRADERVVPSLKQSGSRVSKAAGGQSSRNIQNMRGDQRGATPRASRSAAPSRQAPRPKQSAGSTRRSPSPGSYRPASSMAPSSAPYPKDLQFIASVRQKWNNLPDHHQRRIISICLFVFSLFLFASLTFLSGSGGWGGVGKFFVVFLGWAAYIFAIGLIALSVTLFLESVRQERLVRSTFVGGIGLIWLLLLLESRLILGSMKAGVLAEWLVTPIGSWPAPVQHMTILGLLLIVCILTFRLTFSHVMIIVHLFERFTSIDESKILGNRQPATQIYEDEDDEMELDLDDPVLHNPDLELDDDLNLNQRPQYSRYGAGMSRASALPNRPYVAPEAKISRRPRRTIDQEEAIGYDTDIHDDSTIEFDPQFDDPNQPAYDGTNQSTYMDEEDDPLNDINIHKQQISRVPRGGLRTPNPMALDEHLDARQQPLPLDEDERMTLLSPQQEVPLEPVALNLQPVAKSRGSKRSATAGSNPALPTILSSWTLPNLQLLHNPEATKAQLLGDDTDTLARMIQDTLRSFRVDAEVRKEDISVGPTVIRFGIRPTGKPEMMKDEKTGKMVPVLDAAGQIIYETRTRVSRIMALQNDLALVLESKTIRMEAPVPGRPYVGVEIPNKNSRLVTLREVLESKEYQTARNKSKLAMGLGKDVAGLVRVGDLARMPHLLIAGATGAGKSVCINTIIASILVQATPDDVRLLMVDPKMVELNMYNGIPHLLAPVVIEVDKVVSLLKNAINEMERRYRLFSQLGVRNLDSYRKLRLEKIGQGDTSLINLPAIVIIIDELADLMMAAPEEVEGMICRLAQLARATGIHLVVATQRPSVDVITGLIKANIPTRISFMVSSAVDSRTIIDMGGAERLLGRGDMLYLPADAGRPERIQGAFLSDDEAQALADFWRQQASTRLAAVADNDPGAETILDSRWELKQEHADEVELEDDLLDKAEEVVREYGRASISLLQRRLRVGYSRAARLIDLLENHGVIGQSVDGGRAREVYDNRGGSHYDQDDPNRSSLADEADQILEEERARNDFLRKQAARYQKYE